jgi:hypothetical protein
MTEAIFWSLIEQSRAESKTRPKQIFQILQEKLTRFSSDEILRFDHILHEILRFGYRSNMLAAATIINVTSDLDELNEFESFIIMQGKEVWDNALKNPDSLADMEVEDEAKCSELLEIPEKAYEQASGEEDFEMVHADYQPQNLIGKQDLWQDEKGKVDKVKLKALLPRLYAKWWE